ncbi:MAG: hypothetical protein ACHQ3P_06050 [Candidatus Limnocylindrales bacterium]
MSDGPDQSQVAPAHHDAHDEVHDDAHGGGTGHDAHDAPALGPADWTAWIFGIAGVVIGVLMWAAFAIATS